MSTDLEDEIIRPVFVTHAAGPCFFLNEDMIPGLGKDSDLANWFRALAPTLSANKPRAILLVSAHFETARATVYKREANSMLYDYHGFPPEAYTVQYPAPGSPALAERVVELLGAAGIACETTSTRGLDHGAFVPLKLIYPDADIPVVELGVLSSMSPEEHVAMGRALAPLAREGVLILGSGSATHGRTKPAQTRAFAAWLSETLTSPALTPAEREARLVDWESAPHARVAHPREEHLMPLHVAAAAAGFSRADQLQDAIVDAISLSMGAFQF